MSRPDRPFGVRLVQALGLDPVNTAGVEVAVEPPGDVVTVTVTQRLVDPDLDADVLFVNYVLVTEDELARLRTIEANQR